MGNVQIILLKTLWHDTQTMFLKKDYIMILKFNKFFFATHIFDKEKQLETVIQESFSNTLKAFLHPTTKQGAFSP